MAKSTVVRQDEHPDQDQEGPETMSLEDEISASNAEEERQKIEDMVQIFGSGLQAKFDTQVSLKKEIEQRWLDDLRHHNGVYDKDTEADLANQDNKNKKRSKIFVNLTRAKSNTAESKWSDLVLPTDDRNWGIKPTPVPTLVKALTDSTPLQLADGSTPVDPDTNEPHKAKDLAEETIKEAQNRAEAMQDEIDDQLTEAKFNAVCRDVIHNAVVMGTGIIKGPMVEARSKKAWVENDSGDWVMNFSEENKPTAETVDPWNFFPDMSATRWEDCEFVFERHLLTKKQLRKLAKQPGFMTEQVAKVLTAEPNSRTSDLSYLNELRQINGITQIQQDNRYEILEYHGPIEKSHMIACECEGVEEDNPLEEYEGVVWVSMGIVIKVGLNHMDNEELPYNVLNWEEDDTCIFGFGVPYRMRDPQKVMNASWRMVLDNAGLSTGPQIIINKEMVTPQNGVWELTPRKIWWLNTKDPAFRADYAMHTFDIDSKQPELTAIFEMAHRLADEETSVPQMQMGGQGDSQQPAMLKTLGGTALWMSANNIMMRRAVKHFDDSLTVPFITRFYDWNMQFNKKAAIKGDYSIDARGTSVLLVREMQARNVMEFITAALSMPGGADELKVRGVLKNMAKGMQVSINDVMRTDDESDAAIEEAKTNPPADPELMKLNMQKELLDMKIKADEAARQEEAQLKMTLAEAERQNTMINNQAEMFRFASTSEMDMTKFFEGQKLEKFDTDWKIKAFYEELAQKRAEGDTANYGLEAG